MLYVIVLYIFSRLTIIILLPLINKLAEFFNFHGGGITWQGMNLGWIDNWTAFDSQFYINIAIEGYHLEESTAFFPLYPLLIRFLMYLNIPPSYGGFIISILSFLIGFIMLYKLIINNKNNKYILWLLAFSPITVFFMAVYTESLYFALTVSTFYFFKEKKWFLASLFAGLSSMTRNSGFILFIVIAIEMWDKKESILFYFKRLILNNTIGLVLALSYPIFLWINFNNPFMFITIQSEYWHRYLTFPIKTILGDIQNLINNPNAYFIVIFNLIFLSIIIWMLLNWKHINLSYLIFVVLSVTMPLISPPYWNEIPYTTGLNRYILVLFPIYIFLADKIQNKLIRIVILEINIGIMILFLTAFIGKQFIG